MERAIYGVLCSQRMDLIVIEREQWRSTSHGGDVTVMGIAFLMSKFASQGRQ